MKLSIVMAALLPACADEGCVQVCDRMSLVLVPIVAHDGSARLVPHQLCDSAHLEQDTQTTTVCPKLKGGVQ